MILWLLFAVLTGVAVLAVLAPLSRPAKSAAPASRADLAVYRDQLDEIERDLARGIIAAEEAEAARAELGRRMIAAQSGRAASAAPVVLGANARLASRGLVVVVPLVAVAIYLAFGSPHLPGQPLQARMQAPADQQDVETLIARVEGHLADNPQDGRGWEVLAPVYLRLGRPADAASAWRNTIRLLGPTPERLSHYGEAMVLAEDGIVSDEARDAFEAALTEAPDAPQPRFYLAMAAEQDGDWTLAAERWQAVLADSPEDAPWRTFAVERLAAARQADGEEAFGPTAEDIAAATELSDDERAAMVAGMVERLAARLAAEGHDLDGWLRLARAHSVLGDAEEARKAIAEARMHFKGNADANLRIDEAAHELGLGS